MITVPRLAQGKGYKGPEFYGTTVLCWLPRATFNLTLAHFMVWLCITHGANHERRFPARHPDNEVWGWGQDCISFFWGDADANLIRPLDETERELAENTLQEAFI